MAAQTGKLFILSSWDGASAYVDVLSARSTDFTIANESVDVTTKSSNGWRTLLESAGIGSMTATLEGVFEDAAYEQRLVTLAEGNTHNLYEITSNAGQKFSGTFQITSYGRSGTYNGEEAYTLTLENAGVVTAHRLSDTVAAQDETSFDGTGLNGTFVGGDGVGGTAYIALDTITLSDGTVVTVDAVDGDGDVTQFTVTTASTTSFWYPEVTSLTQSSTSGTGTGFVLNLGANNRANA